MLTSLRALAVFVLLAMTLIGSATAQSQRKSPNDPPPQKTAEPERGPQTDKRGTPEYPLTVNVVPTTEQKADAEKKNANAEFKASDDRKLVEYTGYLVLVGIVQFGVFVLQLIAFTTQAHYMRRTVTEMQNASGAAIRAANAAEDTISHMRETAERQLRAYISITPKDVINWTNKPNRIGVRFDLKNHGQTPGSKIVFNFSMAVLWNPFPPNFILPPTDGQYDQNNALFPLSDVPVGLFINRDLTEEEIRAVEDNSKRFHVWGVMHYRDAFDNPRTTRFSFSFGGVDFANAMKNVAGAKWNWEHGQGHNNEN
jgi:hypothetical protein